MKYTREVLQQAADQSTSIAGVLRALGIRQSGGAQAYLGRRLRKLDIDTSHFTGQAHAKGVPARNRLTWQEILVQRPPGSERVRPHLLRRALVESGIPYKCVGCGLGDDWNGEPITLHVDHIRGDPLDSRPEEVRFLCPNCHSQTPTWAGRNKPRRRQ